MSEYCMRCGNFLCYCEEIKKAEQPHAYGDVYKACKDLYTSEKSDYKIVKNVHEPMNDPRKDEEVTLTLGQLSVLVKQAQEDEREACAKVCDDLAAKDKLSNYYAVAARAIRARGIDGAAVGEVGIWGEEPPKRKWVGLTRRELDIATLGLEDLGDCYIAIEAKLKEKNT